MRMRLPEPDLPEVAAIKPIEKIIVRIHAKEAEKKADKAIIKEVKNKFFGKNKRRK